LFTKLFQELQDALANFKKLLSRFGNHLRRRKPSGFATGPGRIPVYCHLSLAPDFSRVEAGNPMDSRFNGWAAVGARNG
jgi:hypothetical protein